MIDDKKLDNIEDKAKRENDQRALLLIAEVRRLRLALENVKTYVGRDMPRSAWTTADDALKGAGT